jgi:hypothetical protein
MDFTGCVRSPKLALLCEESKARGVLTHQTGKQALDSLRMTPHASDSKASFGLLTHEKGSTDENQ